MSSSLSGTRRSARSRFRRIEPLDARRSRRLQADAQRAPLPPRRGGRNARPLGISERARRETRDRRRHRAARGRRGGRRARAADRALATRRAEAGRGMDLDRVLSDGLRRPHDAAREAQDPLARLRRSDRSARPRQEPARAALGRSPDLGPAATSHPQRRRPPREAARSSGARDPAAPAPPRRAALSPRKAPGGAPLPPRTSAPGPSLLP